MDMQKTYDPKNFEDRIYEYWEKSGFFRAEIDENKVPFTIMMPPPNITGQLHMGHAMDATMQDTLIRFKRMQGYAALWLPGCDHASIATEVKIVEKMRKEEGLTKADVGRERTIRQQNHAAATQDGNVVRLVAAGVHDGRTLLESRARSVRKPL